MIGTDFDWEFEEAVHHAAQIMAMLNEGYAVTAELHDTWLISVGLPVESVQSGNLVTPSPVEWDDGDAVWGSVVMSAAATIAGNADLEALARAPLTGDPGAGEAMLAGIIAELQNEQVAVEGGFTGYVAHALFGAYGDLPMVVLTWDRGFVLVDAVNGEVTGPYEPGTGIDPLPLLARHDDAYEQETAVEVVRSVIQRRSLALRRFIRLGMAAAVLACAGTIVNSDSMRRRLWRAPAPVGIAWNWLTLRGSGFVWEPNGLYRVGELIELRLGERTTWVLARHVCPAGVPSEDGAVVAWAASVRGGHLGPVRHSVEMRSDSPTAWPDIHVGGVAFRSQLLTKTVNGLTPFRLTGRIDAFKRYSQAGAPPYVLAALLSEVERAMDARQLVSP